LVSRALALVFSTPRSTLAPTVSLPSAFRAASAWSSADSFLTLALILSFASTVFSLALSHASEVVSLVLSQASEVFSLTVSLASTALSFSVLLSSALMAGMALRLMPSATARAAVASVYMAGPPRGWWVAKPTPAAEAASGLQQLLGNLFHIGRIDLSLVGFHDVADEAADLLGVGDAERPRTLLHEATQRGDVEAPGEEPLAERDLEPELGRLHGAALAQLLVLGQRLLELGRRGRGQGAELDGGRALEVRDVLAAELDDLGLGRLHPRLEGDERLRPLAPLLVGHGNHRALHDRGVARDGLLHLDGRDVLAA